MRRIVALTVVAVMSLTAVLLADRASASGAAEPAPFKLVISMYGAGSEPVWKSELVFVKGKAFQFVDEPALEVIVNDPATARMELLDLSRRVRCDFTLKQLQQFQVNLHDAIAASCARREAEGGRANEVEAAMSRDLIDPHLTKTYDAKTRRLTLANHTVQIEAIGEPEVDPSRLGLIGASLNALVQLETRRDPQKIPPFVRLETYRTLIAEHHLRPTEITFLYRLKGPPRKLRWKYRLVSELTARELEAIARVEFMRERCSLTRYERFETPASK